ncbi:MAG: aspartyl beta-hydroxylase [Alphaproteobacteria bacterium CG_4_10_14_0_2_um_filter_63_37]|nr:MAG: aspartyl beta-hydroxylase [Proteobacteria bacterium CG1_02_64_396]PJA24794.1 MAG: aspartyl beta-hydroxylase [Alphaproteobacteria bacterium CG_4_10_14_0_2_um_filter_63_37]
MNDRVQLPLRFSVPLLQEAVGRFDEGEWYPHFVPRNYEGRWSVIPLRGPADAQHPVRMCYSDPACDDYADTPFLERSPYLRQVISAFACRMTSVRLMRLEAGSRIKEHIDPDLNPAAGTVRLHVPILTHGEVHFVLNGKRVVMGAGESWYLRLSDPHSVENRGDRARVHLVLDALMNEWLAGMLGREATAI